MLELGEDPKDGRLAKYEKELIKLIKANDNKGIIAFSSRLFSDCIHYLTTSFKLKIPILHLNLMTPSDYTKLCDILESSSGKRPRTDAIIVHNKSGVPPEVCVDFEHHFSYFNSTGKPVNFLINLIASYMEELVHSSDLSKSETEINSLLCDAIEGFTETKLADAVKEERLKHAKKFDVWKKNR